LRVHRRLQGKVVPDALRYGYVLLADIGSQGGLDAAGQKINRMQTQYATVSPTTIFVNAGERVMVQTGTGGGQLEFAPVPPAGAVFNPPPMPLLDGEGNVDMGQTLLWATAWAPSEMREGLRDFVVTRGVEHRRYRYSLRPNVPRRFKTQELPEEYDITEEECAAHFVVGAEKLYETVMGRESVRVEKKTVEIFTREVQTELSLAPPSLADMQRRAQRALMGSGLFSAKEMRRALARRLRVMLAAKGVEDANQGERLDEYLDVLLSHSPQLLDEARRAALAAKAEILEAAELPGALETEEPLPASRLNVYGAYPAGLNTWERTFAEHLDGDETGTVLWWHRNVPHKEWSINVLLEDGRGFFPDFIVGIRQRMREDGGLLADTKYAYETTKELPKLLAEHRAYGRVLIVTKDGEGRWGIAGINPRTNRAEVRKRLKVAEMAGY
jgi:hypothetical protein